MAVTKRGNVHRYRGVGAELTAQAGDGCVILHVTEERGGRNYTSKVRVRLRDIPQIRDVILSARDDAKVWQPAKPVVQPERRRGPRIGKIH
jgi:hypothetical protein